MLSLTKLYAIAFCLMILPDLLLMFTGIGLMFFVDHQVLGASLFVSGFCLTVPSVGLLAMALNCIDAHSLESVRLTNV
jgi:hypothetical protein